jgi:hypothetical protein
MFEKWRDAFAIDNLYVVYLSHQIIVTSGFSLDH